MKFTKTNTIAILLTSVALLSGCDTTNQQAGTLVGAGAGALLGSQFGGGTGRIFTALGGAALGGFIGNQVGASMDQTAQLKANQSLQAGAPMNWSENDGSYYQFQPNETIVYENNVPCRHFSVIIVRQDGTRRLVRGVACRTAPGRWVIVRQHEERIVSYYNY